MRRHLARALLTCVFCAAVVVVVRSEGDIPWRTNVRTASAAAVPANKPMLIEFWAVWCPPCKVMDEEVYTNAAVKEMMTKVLPVRIDVDTQESVVRQYGIASMPTLIFADSYGNELFRFTGNVSADTMTKLLDELPGDVTGINRLMPIIAKEKDNFAALEGLGRELKRVKLFRASNRYYDRAMRVRAPADQAVTRGDILVAMGENHLELKEYRDAEECFTRYLKEFRGGPQEARAARGLARARITSRRPASRTP